MKLITHRATDGEFIGRIVRDDLRTALHLTEDGQFYFYTSKGEVDGFEPISIDKARQWTADNLESKVYAQVFGDTA